MKGEARTKVGDHIPRHPEPFREFRVAFDLVEEGARRIMQEVGEEIESTSVGHAKEDVFDPGCMGFV